MSTHRAEIDWLAIVARRLGAKVDLILDADGRVDAIDVQDLPGMRSFHAPPIAMVESLRRVIGVQAQDPKRSVLLDDPRVYCYHYDPQQLLAYGGVDSLLQQRIYQGKIADGACFASAETPPVTGKTADLLQGDDRDASLRYWRCDGGKLVEVASLEALRSHLPAARQSRPDDDGPTP